MYTFETDLSFIVSRESNTYKSFVDFLVFLNQSEFLPSDMAFIERDGVSYKIPVQDLINEITPTTTFDIK